MTDTFTFNSNPQESKKSKPYLLGEIFDPTGKVNELFVDSSFNHNLTTASLTRSQISADSSSSTQIASPSYSHLQQMNHQQSHNFQFQPPLPVDQMQPYHYPQNGQYQMQANGTNSYVETHSFIQQKMHNPHYNSAGSFYNKQGTRYENDAPLKQLKFKEMKNPRSSASDSILSSSRASLLQLRPQHTKDSSISTKTLDIEYPKAVKPKIATTFWEEKNTTCYQVELRGVMVSRREDNNQINGTKLLNTTGMSRGKRDGILKNEKQRNGEVVKSGSMNLKGIWIPFERAHEIARNEGVDRLLFPLFVKDLKSFYAKKGEQLRCEDSEDEGANMDRTLPLSSPSDNTSGSIEDPSDPHGYSDTYGLLQDNYFNDTQQKLNYLQQ